MKVKNKLIMGISLISLAMYTNVFAYLQPNCKTQSFSSCLPCLKYYPSPFTGYYIGGSLTGMLNNDFSFHDNSDHIIDQGEFSPVVGFFGGYRAIFSHLYSLGGEISINTTLGDANTNTTVMDHGGTHVRNNTRYSYSISFLPGMLFNNCTLAFLRLGYIGTYFDSMVFDPLMGRSSQHGVQPGYELGFGLETIIMRHLNFRADYSHSKYKFITTNISHYNVQPSNDRVSFSLVYTFC